MTALERAGHSTKITIGLVLALGGFSRGFRRAALQLSHVQMPIPLFHRVATRLGRGP